MPAFHDGYDGLLYPWLVNAADLDVGASTGKRTCTDLFRVAQYRKIGVVSRKDELDALLERPYQLDDILKNGLVVQVVFGLVNDDYIVVALAQNEEDQCGSPLPQRMIAQLLSVILDSEDVWHLPGEQ